MTLLFLPASRDPERAAAIHRQALSWYAPADHETKGDTADGQR
jgi:hypothetical protein